MKNIEDEIKSQKRECDVLRGKRLKKLRSMTTLSIEDFAKQLGVTRVSVSYWENASQRTLSNGRARKIITFIHEKYNIECSFNWLWEGMGPEPRYLGTASHSFTNIEKEIEFFKEMHHDAVFVKVDSGKLLPYFMFNDVIAGLWRPIDVLQAEEFCIVRINNRDEIRWVKKIDSHASKKAQISLLPPDKEGLAEEIIVEKIAPIMRVWRIKNS